MEYEVNGFLQHFGEAGLELVVCPSSVTSLVISDEAQGVLLRSCRDVARWENRQLRWFLMTNLMMHTNEDWNQALIQLVLRCRH